MPIFHNRKTLQINKKPPLSKLNKIKNKIFLKIQSSHWSNEESLQIMSPGNTTFMGSDIYKSII